jgi:hypothetical protein
VAFRAFAPSLALDLASARATRVADEKRDE